MTICANHTQVQYVDKQHTFLILTIGEKILSYPQEITIASKEQLNVLSSFLLQTIEELEKYITEHNIPCAENRRGEDIGKLTVTGVWRGSDPSLCTNSTNTYPSAPLSSSEKTYSLCYVKELIRAVWAIFKIKLAIHRVYFYCSPFFPKISTLYPILFYALSPGYGFKMETIPLRIFPTRGSLVSWLKEGHLKKSPQNAIFVFARYPTVEEDIALLQGLLKQGHQILIQCCNKMPLLSNWQSKSVRAGMLYFSPPESWLESRQWNLKTLNWPKISIVMPSLNQAEFIQQALDSIFAQNYPNLEIIVLDPGSTDGTREILAEYKDRIGRLILEPDKGQSDALERGLNMAQGEILTWLCTDDMLESDSLFHVAEAFMRYKTDIVVGGCRRIDEAGNELSRHYSAMPFNQAIPLDSLGMIDVLHSWQAGHFFYQPEVFFTRNIWRRAGAFFHQSAFYGMDYDLWVRMALAGARGVQIFHYVAASREQKNQKTIIGQPDYLWQCANFLRHYNEIIMTAAKMEKGG